MALQVKLLRFVEKQEFIRVGGNKAIQVDVRILAATNRDLEKMVNDNEFRLDLYYRLNVLQLNIPPLRERPEDIIPLVEHFLTKCNKKYCVKKKVSNDLLRFLLSYSWPGNIRQLENLIERVVITADQSVLLLDHLPDTLNPRIPALPSNTYPLNLDTIPLSNYKRAVHFSILFGDYTPNKMLFLFSTHFWVGIIFAYKSLALRLLGRTSCLILLCVRSESYS